MPETIHARLLLTKRKPLSLDLTEALYNGVMRIDVENVGRDYCAEPSWLEQMFRILYWMSVISPKVLNRLVTK